MDGSGFRRADRNVCRVAGRTHEPHRRTGIELQDLRRIRQGLEKPRALLETVNRGKHLADRSERKITDSAQTVLDARCLLADDRHLVLTQEVVGFIDTAGRRVLDRQDREVDLSRLQCVNGGLVGARHHHLTIDLTRRQVLLCREVAEGMLTTHRNPQGHLRPDARTTRHLPADQLRQEVAIDPADQVDRGAFYPRDVLDRREHLTFALGVTDGGVGGGFLPRDILDDAESLRDQFDDTLVEIAKTPSEGEQLSVDFGHAASVRSGGRRGGPAYGDITRPTTSRHRSRCRARPTRAGGAYAPRGRNHTPARRATSPSRRCPSIPAARG